MPKTTPPQQTNASPVELRGQLERVTYEESCYPTELDKEEKAFSPYNRRDSNKDSQLK